MSTLPTVPTIIRFILRLRNSIFFVCRGVKGSYFVTVRMNVDPILRNLFGNWEMFVSWTERKIIIIGGHHQADTKLRLFIIFILSPWMQLQMQSLLLVTYFFDYGKIIFVFNQLDSLTQTKHTIMQWKPLFKGMNWLHYQNITIS